MNIVYSASDLYSSLAGISMTSLFINNAWADEINVYVLDNGISDKNKEKLLKLGEKYGRNVSFFLLPKSLTESDINIQRWNISTFGRLFEASSLPVSVKKVIHIDCDTVIDGSLEPLWVLDMEGKAVAGALECLSEHYKKMIGLGANDHYINAGNIVLNLDYIRKKDYEQQFLSYISTHASMLTYVDQEVLNAVIPDEGKMIVPLCFNSYSIIHYFNYAQLKKVRSVKMFCSPDEYRDAKSKPVIIHYTTCFMEGTRPWIKGDKHPLKEKFLYYKNKSPWMDMEDWPDKRSGKDKVLKILFNITPKLLLCSVVGFVHGTFVPWNNQRILNKTR